MVTSGLEFAQVDLADLLPPIHVAVDPGTGTAGYTFPLPLPAGRLGFGPALGLSFRDGAGNSPFGFGWSLSGLTSIVVHNTRSHPKYDGTDRYALDGVELVPTVEGGKAAEWDTATHHVRRFRGRRGSSLARVEQWTDHTDRDTHWRVRRPDGSVAIFGRRRDGSGRIRNPVRPSEVHEWLLEAQFDRVGNAIRYDYAAEDGAGVDWSSPAEYPRLGAGFAQRLLQRVRYANAAPLHPDTEDDDSDTVWHYEVVLDHGDHSSADAPQVEPDRAWPVRADAYSSNRPGFEVRTYRLCRRFLLFHRFAELGPTPVLIRTIELTHHEAGTGSALTRIQVRGFRHEAGTTTSTALPAINLRYSQSRVEQRLRILDPASGENLPQGLHGSDYRWADVRGEGLPGVLSLTDGAWWFKPNLGGGQLGPQTRLAQQPSATTAGAVLADFDRDGNFDLAVLEGRHAGYCEFDRDTQDWTAFRPFAQTPMMAGPGRADWVDVDGDGRPDSLLALKERSLQFPALGKAGYGAPRTLPRSDPTTPVLAERPEVGVFLADMTGDGLLDVVHLRNGRVEYWPGLPGGGLGAPVVMADPPTSAGGRELDTRRWRFVDLDGTGTADLLHVGDDAIRWWRNASGNGFEPGGQITGLPLADDLCSAQILDLLGDGTQCLVWSSGLVSDAGAPLRYLRLMADGPPSVSNPAPGCRLTGSPSI